MFFALPTNCRRTENRLQAVRVKRMAVNNTLFYLFCKLYINVQYLC